MVTGSSPEIETSERKFERNACSVQKMIDPITGPKIVAAPPSSKEVQMKNVSEVTKTPGDTLAKAA